MTQHSSYASPAAPSSVDDRVNNAADKSTQLNKLQQEGANVLTDPTAKLVTQNNEAIGTPAAKVTADSIIFQGAPEPTETKPQSGAALDGILHTGMLFGEGLVSGSVGNAINGVKQIYDHAAGDEYKPTQLFSNQQDVDNSWAGKIGEVGGTVLDFAGLTLATGGVAGAAGLTGYAALATAAGVAGAVEGGVFTPSRDQDFIAGRLENGAIASVASVATLGAGAAVNAVTQNITNGIASVAARVAGNILSGAGTGAATVEAGSLATYGKLAAPDQLGLAIAAGVAGGAISAALVSAPDSTAAPERTLDTAAPSPPEVPSPIAPADVPKSTMPVVSKPAQILPVKSDNLESPVKSSEQAPSEQASLSEELRSRIAAGAKEAKTDPDFYAVSTLKDANEVSQYAKDYYARDPKVAIRNMEFATQHNLVAADSKAAWSQAISGLKSEHPDAGASHVQETTASPSAKPNGKGYPQRVPVKPGATFNNQSADYGQPEYTAPSVLENDRTVNPTGWADPPDASLSKNAIDPNWDSFEKNIKVNSSNQPLNPHEVTGLSGRGLLGNWGANHAADPIVTRTGPDGDLQGLLVLRGDSLRPGSDWKLALPGGMVNKGEMVTAALKRELGEETSVNLDFDNATPIYRGYVVDPRNTDNAWMETEARHLHLEDGSRVQPRGGDDAAAAKWIPLDHQTIADLYGDHAQLIRRSIAKWSEDTGNTVDSSGYVHATN